jgi:phospholipase C
VLEGYSGQTTPLTVRAGERLMKSWRLESSFGWYDLRVECVSDPGFLQHFAGHLESEEDSMSDPAIGAKKG